MKKKKLLGKDFLVWQSSTFLPSKLKANYMDQLCKKKLFFFHLSNETFLNKVSYSLDLCLQLVTQ